MSMTITEVEKVNERIKNGKIIEQRMCDFIIELNSVSEERLNAIALTDGVREYTYRQMFRKWEEYAEAFSSVGMTGENRSRVGVFSFTTIETIFSVYALNMTGASISMIELESMFKWNSLKRTIRKEKLTDLVILDNIMLPNQFQMLEQEKRNLGLRNIILLHTNMDVPFAKRRLIMISDLLSGMARRNPDAVYLDELVEKDTAASISTLGKTSEEAALILHTSGTTSGIKKPIPYTNSAVNEGAARFLRNDEFCDMFQGTAVSLASFFLAACYFMIDQLHLPLAFGGKVVAIPLIGLFPDLVFRAYDEYGVTIAFTGSGAFSDKHALPKVDLSCMKLLALGGTYVSQDNKRKIDSFLKERGMKYDSTIGYGLSEAGGACFLSERGTNNDTLGKPLPGIKVMLLDEDDEKYYRPEDGQRRGVLMISTPSLSTGRIGDTVYFEHTVIDGEPYINTKDLVEVGEDGRLKIVGRSNKFFTNDAGIRFDAGLVERAISAQPGIIDCGIAPEFFKKISDTVPALYVKTDGQDKDAEEILKKALVNVFMGDGKIAETNVPYMCVIVNDIPYTETGKVDVHKFNNHECDGVLYLVDSKFKDGELCDIRLEKCEGPIGLRPPNNEKKDPLKILIDFIAEKDQAAHSHGNECRRRNNSPVPPHRRGGHSGRHGNAHDIMALMKIISEMATLSGEQEADEPPRPKRRERPGCMRMQRRTCRDKRRNMHPHDEHRPPVRQRRSEPPMAELFRMMQSMRGQFDETYEEQNYREENDFDRIPPFFRMIREGQNADRRNSPLSRMTEFGRRIVDPETGIPPFPCFMIDPQDHDSEYDEYEEYEDYEESEDSLNDEHRERTTPFNGPFAEILGRLFHASDYDEFYED